MPYVLGTQLSAVNRREALNRFIHRYTKEHKPAWANKPRPDGSVYPVHFASDDDWLAHTSFAITAKGELSRKERYCQSSPTWPDNPELRRHIAPADMDEQNTA